MAALEVKHEKGGASATLDEAMILTGFGVYNILHLLLCGLILLGMILQCLVLGYVMPAAQCDLNLTLVQKGWIAATPFLAIILTSYMWGWLADTRGRRSIMLFSMMASVVFSCVSSFAPDSISLSVLTFLAAIFMSGSSAVVYTYLGEFSSVRHRDKMVVFGSSFVGIGTVLLPAVAWLILSFDFQLSIGFLGFYYRPWRLLIVASNLPFVLAIASIAFFPESPKFLSSCGKQMESLEVVKKIYNVNMRMPEDTFPIKSLLVEAEPPTSNERKGAAAVLVSMRDQTVPLFKYPLLPWTCLTCFVQFGLLSCANGFYVWFPTILNSLLTHDGAETRICDILDAAQSLPINGTIVECDDSLDKGIFELSIYVGLVFCSMYIIVGFLVDFVGKKQIIIVILTVTGLCGIGTHHANNQNLAVGLFAIFQMCGACIGLMNAVAVEIFPTKYRAMAVCLSMMMGRVGSMVGSNVIGFLLERNCGLNFYLFGGVLLVCAVSCLTIPSGNISPATKPT